MIIIFLLQLDVQNGRNYRLPLTVIRVTEDDGPEDDDSRCPNCGSLQTVLNIDQTRKKSYKQTLANDSILMEGLWEINESAILKISEEKRENHHR